MRFMRTFGLLVALGVAVPAFAQGGSPMPPDVPQDLTQYYLVLYRQGPNAAPVSPAQADSAQRAHLAHLRKLAEQKKFVVYGPATDGGSIIGIIIVAATSAAEAREWAEEDPGVRNGTLALDVHGVMLPSLADVRIRY